MVFLFALCFAGCGNGNNSSKEIETIKAQCKEDVETEIYAKYYVTPIESAARNGETHKGFDVDSCEKKSGDNFYAIKGTRLLDLPLAPQKGIYKCDFVTEYSIKEVGSVYRKDIELSNPGIYKLS